MARVHVETEKASAEEGQVRRQISESVELRMALHAEAAKLVEIAQVIAAALKHGNRVYTFGNGGSACDAEHIAAELSGRFNMDRASLPAHALTANTSSLTAIANDYGYEAVFSHPIAGICKPGDVVVALSAGGNSPNVVKGVQTARAMGAVVVGFTGKQGGQLKELAHFVVHVPSSNTARIQEIHMTCGHIVCGLVEQALFGAPAATA